MRWVLVRRFSGSRTAVLVFESEASANAFADTRRLPGQRADAIIVRSATASDDFGPEVCVTDWRAGGPPELTVRPTPAELPRHGEFNSIPTYLASKGVAC